MFKDSYPFRCPAKGGHHEKTLAKNVLNHLADWDLVAYRLKSAEQELQGHPYPRQTDLK